MNCFVIGSDILTNKGHVVGVCLNDKVQLNDVTFISGNEVKINSQLD